MSGHSSSLFRLLAFIFALLAISPAARSEELVISSFEDAGQLSKLEKREQIKVVSEYATEGGHSGKVPAPFSIVAGSWTRFPEDWSGYDRLCLDVYNPGKPARGSLWFADAQGNDYWQRHNNSFNIRAGANTLSWPVGGLYRGEKGSGKFLDPKQIRQIVILLPDNGAGAYYLDNFRLVKGEAGVKIKTLISFEDGEKAGAEWSIEDWPKDKPGKSVGEVVAEHVTDGDKALKLSYRENSGHIYVHGFDPDWSGYDTLRIDCFNPTDKVVTVSGWFRDEESKTGDYWKRHNYRKNIPPGASTISFPVGGLYRGEKGSGNFLDTRRMDSFCIVCSGVTLYYDNFRLVKGSSSVNVPGLVALDFGPADSPNFPGFKPVHPDTTYSEKTGFGWLRDTNRDARNYEQPDSLLCDFIHLWNGERFAAKVDNGDYFVQLMFDIPSFWEIMYYKNRSVRAEDKVVYEETQSPEDYFKNKFFRFQDTEDLPGTDIWEKYVKAKYHPVEFKVKVSDGKLDIQFLGDSWGLTPSYMVIFPASEMENGRKWLESVEARRREEFNTNYMETIRPAEPKPEISAADKTAGFVLFRRALDKDVWYNSAPGADSTDTLEVKINWAACPGEYESAAVSVYPLKDCGDLRVEFHDLTGPGGAAIPASVLRARSIRYKFKRVGGRITSSYEYRPWTMVDFDSQPLPAGVTRRIWLTLRLPADALPGKYSGRITLSLAGATRDIPVFLKVYPFTLDEVAIPLGMFGSSGPNRNGYWPKDVKDYFGWWKRTEEVLRDVREHGMTAVTPPAPGFKGIKDGKAVFIYDNTDRFMELLKKLGFHQECYTYASMFKVRDGDIEKIAMDRYGVPLEKAIKIAYRDLGAHSKEKGWLPIAWALGDEPLIHGISAETVIKVYEAHRAAAPQMQFTIDDAMADPKHWEVIPHIDVICANTPRYAVAKQVKKAGNRYWFNNIGTNRYIFGWFMWSAREKMNVEALFQWGYSTNYADIYYDLDGFEGDSGQTVTASEGQRARRSWEMIREGADDHRYLETLNNLLKETNKSGSTAAKATAKQARAFVKETVEKVDLENKSNIALPQVELEKLKRTLAGYIILLREQLGK